MITVVRLRERDRRRNFHMKVYFSAVSRTKYTAGEGGRPSALKIVKSMDEVEELKQFPQFEILRFEDMEELTEFVQKEMEARAHNGLPAIRAAVIGAGKSAPHGDSPQRRSAHEREPAVRRRLPVEALSSPLSDPTKTNTGRKPVAPPLEAKKPVKVAPKPKPIPKKVPSTEGKTKSQLLKIAEGLGLKVTPKMKKGEIERIINIASH